MATLSVALKLKQIIDFFDEEIFNLMDFDCDQREQCSFFLYSSIILKNKALVETTWLSELNER